MTQEQATQVEVIAAYDGWKYESEEWDMMYKVSEGFYYHEDERFEDLDIGSLEDMQYHSSDNWIMPVARKVWRELENMLMEDMTNNELLDKIQDFEHAAFQSTAELCTEVYQAIIYLQKLNKTK